jgi:hypothetical protein
MKSAYELAMERLQQDDPTPSVSLTEKQKTALAEVETKYKARKAEREIFLQKQILEARRKGDRTEFDMLEKQLRNERLRLDEECEAAKARIRAESAE